MVVVLFTNFVDTDCKSALSIVEYIRAVGIYGFTTKKAFSESNSNVVICSN